MLLLALLVSVVREHVYLLDEVGVHTLDGARVELLLLETDPLAGHSPSILFLRIKQLISH